MRTFTRTAPDLLARTALFFALTTPCAYLAAEDQKTDSPTLRAAAPHTRVIKHETRAGDPRHAAEAGRICDENRNGDCDVILQRIGRKPVVGVLFAPDPAGGVRIAGVTPDGAAAGVGIRSGDRLMRIAGKPIVGDTPEARVDNARLQLQGLDVKTAVKLTYARDGRENTVDVTPKLDERIMVFTGDGTMMRPGGNVVVRRIDGRTDVEADGFEIETRVDGHALTAGDTARVHVFKGDASGQPRGEWRVIRIECKGGDAECRERAETGFGDADAIRGARVFRFDCKPGETCAGQQRLAEAFRWNDLNLASVDAQLGRYFGTDTGVLVLSTGPTLGQLQAGDVIRRVDGKAVDTPRAVMDALRDKPANSTVAIEYLRDRISASAQLKVPKAMSFPMPPCRRIRPRPVARRKPRRHADAPQDRDGRQGRAGADLGRRWQRCRADAVGAAGTSSPARPAARRLKIADKTARKIFGRVAFVSENTRRLASGGPVGLPAREESGRRAPAILP